MDSVFYMAQGIMPWEISHFGCDFCDITEVRGNFLILGGADEGLFVLGSYV
jgi:hypothetical protein